MARHGRPEAVRTDRGGAFVAFTKDGDFGRVLEAELVDHIVGRSYSPRGGGKIESAIGPSSASCGSAVLCAGRPWRIGGPHGR